MHSEVDDEPFAIKQAWGLVAPAAKGPRARFELDEVVAAAAELADEEGFDAVTLNAVASRLGMTTTALYRYVDSKETLAELAVDGALGPAPTAGPHRATTVEAWVDRLWARYLAHPWMATFPLRRAPRCPHAFGWWDGLIGLLADAGDTDPGATAIALDVLVRGYAGVHGAEPSSTLGPSIQAELLRRHPAALHHSQALRAPREQLDAAVARLLRSG